MAIMGDVGNPNSRVLKVGNNINSEVTQRVRVTNVVH
jgi:hypothetical protein